MYKTKTRHHNSKHCDIVMFFVLMLKNPVAFVVSTFVVDADDDVVTFVVERRQLHVLWHLSSRHRPKNLFGVDLHWREPPLVLHNVDIYSIIILHHSSLATLIHANTLVSETCYSPKYWWITMISYMLWLSATRFLSWDVIWFWIGLCILNIHVSPDLTWGHNLSHSRTDTAQNRFTTIFCSNHNYHIWEITVY